MPIAPAFAGPVGGVVVGGSAQINNPGTANVTINQFSDKAIINWHMFNIGVGEKTTFVQPNANSIALNRVVGGMGPSEILGSLNANGKVFVVNKDGIIFGAGAVINTAGFLATTSDIRNEDFMAGRFNFQIPGRPDASIVNMGTITATNGGFAALVAPGVRNSGTITAHLGTVTLASGNTFSLDFYGDRLVQLGVGDEIASHVKDVATGQTLKSLVTNEGKLKANGGRVELTAAAARHVVDSVINTSGVIEANSVGVKNGQIVLGAATATYAGGGRGQAATLASSLPPQKVKVSGTLSAAGKKAGTKGGTITITGEHIEVAGATINASGREGGGKVMIGGDWGGGKPDTSLVSNQSAKLEANAIPTATTVSVDAATKIDASAKDKGDGGKVILWANDRLTFTGTILALGAKDIGNGGFVETSGHSTSVGGTISAGKGGLWLLDPANLNIGSTEAATINASLNSGTDVLQQTGTSGPGTGDIIVSSQISWNTSATLTLLAFHNIQINDAGPFSGTIVNTGAGKLVMHADSTGTGSGTIVMPAGTTSQRINWTGSTGTVTIYYNPTVFGTQDNFTSGNGHIGLATPSQLTQYMLVNTETKLQNMGVNLAGNYALAKDINAGSIPNFAPIGAAGLPFTGKFDGQNHTISNLTIAPTTPSAFGISVGMFGTIGATGNVSNLTITNANVTANPNVTGPGQFIGILAGSNGGTVSNVTVDGTVSHGTAQNGVVAGGLIGQNGIFGPSSSMGTITLSNANVTVSVGSATSGSSGNSAGGLVGSNPGTIATSFATGDVSGGANSFIGGLAGRNDPGATITGSGAAGNVTNTNAAGSGAGGFVGFNFGTISGINVATGNVTGATATAMFQSGQFGGFVGLNDAAGVISGGVAGGNVSAGGPNSVGGFVGFNNGTISGSGAAGNVTGGNNFTGGFVGGNLGDISGSVAVGAVSGGGFGTGGFAGMNGVNQQTGHVGTITGSAATGTVQSTAPGDDGNVGGFVGQNQGAAVISVSQAFGNVTANSGAGGFAGNNNGTISNSFAFGTVTVGNAGTAGGFISGNEGQITNSTATGNVSGGNNSVLGGFAAGNFGSISGSTASGSVSSSGPNSAVAGFAGANTGNLINVTSSGPVSGTSDSFLGGLVGVNLALIKDSTSSSTVTGSGANNIAGGLVGLNFGLVDPSTSTGNASSGPNSIVGMLIGANGALRFPDGSQIIGTNTADSIGTGTASGGSGSTVGGQVGKSYPTAGLPGLPAGTCENGGQYCGGTLFNPNGTPVNPQQPHQPDHLVDNTSIVQISPQTNITQTMTADLNTEKKSDPVITNQSGSGSGSGGSAPGGQKGGGAAGGSR
ncbi:MAG: filamentous hemagglutinin N-terminal domain-containing protein, partial [Xanthobacteraceae bacterium]